MAKIKLTKGELKRERDALRQYERYLPTLQLKKQQLQMEILRQHNMLDLKIRAERQSLDGILPWAGLLSENGADIRALVTPSDIVTGSRNVAGVDLPTFDKVLYKEIDYDLFLTPLWVDAAVETLRKLVAIREEIEIMKVAVDLLRQELRITTQRVNLFEKVKIPEAEDAIRRIKIYIGDQMANAVGRSKIAKRKIETAELEGATA